MKKILVCCLSALALTVARGQEKTLPTLFVAPLDGDTSAIMAWQPSLGEGLAEMLITEVSRSTKYQVLESTALKDLAEEIKLGESGYVADQEKVDKGGWAGADFMLRGKVTRFGNKEQSGGLGGFTSGSLGALGVKVTTADVRIDWRLVDVYSRKIIKTGSATAAQKGTSFDVGTIVNGSGGVVGFDNREFMNSALGKAACKAITNLVQEIVGIDLPESGRLKSKAAASAKMQNEAHAATDALRASPGKVLAVVDKSTMIVSVGSKHGFKAGDKLKLYETIDIKDDKGAVVFTDEKLAGEVTLDGVQDERSKATYTCDSEARPGWTVKAK